MVPFPLAVMLSLLLSVHFISSLCLFFLLLIVVMYITPAITLHLLALPSGSPLLPLTLSGMYFHPETTSH